MRRNLRRGTDVSRETLARLSAYAALLVDWNSRHNLVSRAGLDDLWRRHFWDSAPSCCPLSRRKPSTLADLGSGAGFPGLVLAAMLRDLAVTLFEATTKKCAFLQAAAEAMSLTVTIRNVRMEDAPPKPLMSSPARACAPLPRLLAYAQPFTGPKSVCLFLKGQNLGSELTEAHKSWKMKASQIPKPVRSLGCYCDGERAGPP